jgi:drug/metabolite transporter (DMT)-like permease
VDQGTQREGQGRRKATAIGAIAVLLWATLAALAVRLGAVPPFQLLAMAFATAFAAGCLWLLATGGPARLRLLAQPPLFWLLATFGLYAYHALYFLALRLAPAAEANLINYLWPLLIVLFSAFLPGAEGLRPRQVLGASMGLLGTGLLIASAGGLGGAGASLWGYAAALACALVWSSYSVLNRRFSAVPSEAMIGICGAVALLGFLTHLAAEPAGFRPSGGEALAIAAMGIGPLGLAFLAWDHGTKHGDLPVLGTLAYAAPILSTLLLVVLGRAVPSLELAAACGLVAGGGWIATRFEPAR